MMSRLPEQNFMEAPFVTNISTNNSDNSQFLLNTSLAAQSGVGVSFAASGSSISFASHSRSNDESSLINNSTSHLDQSSYEAAGDSIIKKNRRGNKEEDKIAKNKKR